ncbi:Snapin/Pallidin-domain-containing protein [Umbelopsis sp. PMI_123]|nr:Snapin/Pallidin-domain-containing protein [Umbelopsis sp. PMI_123]
MPEDTEIVHRELEDSQAHSHVTDGLLSVIQPVIYETDLRIVGVRQSQNELNKEIERLIAELQLFSDITDPPALQASHTKLMTARKQLAHSNQLLQNVHNRIVRMQEQLNQSKRNKK